MTGLITKAALLSACGMLLAVAAFAGVPTAAQSTSPAFLRLSGHNGAGAPDSTTSKITITVNDVAHNPINGSNVVLDFSACTADIHISSNQLNPNYTTACGTQYTVSAYTNSAGKVAFTLQGFSKSTDATHTIAGCARIYADGVLLSSPTVATPDMDGANGVSPADLGAILGDLSASGHPYRARADMDGSGTLSPADLSVELGFASGVGHNTTISSTPACP